MSTTSRTGLGVFLGLLCAFGLLLAVAGAYSLATAHESVLDASAEIRVASLRGDYVSPEDSASLLREGGMAARAQRSSGLATLAAGVALMLPLPLLALRRR